MMMMRPFRYISGEAFSFHEWWGLFVAWVVRPFHCMSGEAFSLHESWGLFVAWLVRPFRSLTGEALSLQEWWGLFVHEFWGLFKASLMTNAFTKFGFMKTMRWLSHFVYTTKFFKAWFTGTSFVLKVFNQCIYNGWIDHYYGRTIFFCLERPSS